MPSNQKLPLGTILQLEIHTALSVKPLTMSGGVVWVHEQDDGKYPFEMGIKFIKILPDDLRVLSHICGAQMEEKNTIRWIG